MSSDDKVDNNPRAMAAKVDIRHRVLEAIGTRARVFDAFAGDGHMHSAVWANAFGYVGCDLKYKPLTGDARAMFAADNRRVMRAIDLGAFNIFDLDAHGSPWEQAVIIADRRKVAGGERVGLVITNGDGRAFTIRANLPLPYAIRELAGLRGDVAGVGPNAKTVEHRIVIGLAKRMRCTIIKRWQAKGKTGAAVIYTGLILEGKQS
jgi:hypothetical protein